MNTPNYMKRARSLGITVLLIVATNFGISYVSSASSDRAGVGVLQGNTPRPRAGVGVLQGNTPRPRAGVGVLQGNTPRP